MRTVRRSLRSSVPRRLNRTMTAVIFDCDGVGHDEVLFLEIELISLKEIGLEFDIEAYQKRHLGTTSTEVLPRDRSRYQAKFDAPLPKGFAKPLANVRSVLDPDSNYDGVHDLLSSLDHIRHGRVRIVAGRACSVCAR